MIEPNDDTTASTPPEKRWKAHSDRPPGREAIIRAYLVLLGHPPVIHPTVLERIRREEAEKKPESETAAQR
jgi:hypothetical protein